MKVTAVIAEYNPFHNGHAYQLQEARRLTGADFILVVLSGNFVQRGTPALADKYTRARMALLGGADLVLELPLCYACGSAEYFAGGAVALLNALGCVDFLCFGSECGSLAPLRQIAEVLTQEPETYRRALQAGLKAGFSFPKARELALDASLPLAFPRDALASLLSSPNNILGIEYLRALKKTGSQLVPVTVRRLGQGYHDTKTDLPYASATALRTAFAQTAGAKEAPPSVFPCVPPAVREIFRQEYGQTLPVFADDFSSLLQYRLLSAQSWETFARCFDVSPSFARRAFKMRYQFRDFSSFASLLGTRSYTEAYARRALLHILLELPADWPGLSQKRSYYLKPLGLRQEAQPLLHAIKKNGSLPLLSKLADARHLISSFAAFSARERQEALLTFHTELRASELYQIALTQKFHLPAGSECAHPLVLL